MIDYKMTLDIAIGILIAIGIGVIIGVNIGIGIRRHQYAYNGCLIIKSCLHGQGRSEATVD